jgi:hypothetical protein
MRSLLGAHQHFSELACSREGVRDKQKLVWTCRLRRDVRLQLACFNLYSSPVLLFMPQICFPSVP